MNILLDVLGQNSTFLQQTARDYCSLWRYIHEHKLLLVFIRVTSFVIQATQRHWQMCKFVQNSHWWFHVRFTRKKHKIPKYFMKSVPLCQSKILTPSTFCLNRAAEAFFFSWNILGTHHTSALSLSIMILWSILFIFGLCATWSWCQSYSNYNTVKRMTEILCPGTP